MLFSTSGIPFAYCNSVNASTGDITIYSTQTGTNYWPNTGSIPTRFYSQNNVIARAFFIKNQTLNLPGNMEENKIYYLRKTGTNVKIYLTFQDAVNQSGHITFTNTVSGYLFAVYFPDLCYRYLNAWKPAEESISDIPCCPSVPEVYTECPDTATVTYMGNSVEIKRNGVVSLTGTGLDQIKALQSGGFSAHEIITLAGIYDPYVNPPTLIRPGFLIIIGIGVGYSPEEPYTPALFLRFFTDDSSIFPEYRYRFMGIARYKGSASINDSKTMNFIYDGDDFIKGNINIYGYSIWLFLNDLKQNGSLPDTIPVTFSGSTPPPSHVKVFMPDAFFANKNKPINLGHVEETLTYDPDTLTYWGDVKTYAGIPGRLQFSIPNYYPLLSSGTKYLANSAFVIEYESNSYPYYRFRRNGEFPDANLNSYSNAEFSLYESCYVEHIVDLYNSFEIYEHKFRLFVASDAYGGYPTGLPQGKTWFDSRIVQNANPDWVGYPVNRLTSKMLISFSKWGTGKFNKSNGVQGFDSTYWNNTAGHYKKNFYAIKSVHPNAHITSLGV